MLYIDFSKFTKDQIKELALIAIANDPYFDNPDGLVEFTVAI